MHRRKFLGLAGAGMAGALAGCGGCGEEECEYEDEEEGGFGGEEDDSLWQPKGGPENPWRRTDLD